MYIEMDTSLWTSCGGRWEMTGERERENALLHQTNSLPNYKIQQMNRGECQNGLPVIFSMREMMCLP